MMTNQVTITIDDKRVTVPAGTTVLEAAKTMGVEIPHYCYHPGLSIAGNCRMCLVEVEKTSKPMIGCNTFVAQGMVVRTNTPAVTKMRKSIMEFLLINHPLDCPTCDQAGECRLQDYYMSYDEVPSRFKEGKVHKDKMVDLGANVMLDQERCIACTRCIRFCQEVAKEDELGLAYRGDHVTITTFPGKKMKNPYAGNVVDICPVGALTNKEFRFKKRVWMLTSTPSVCPGCSRGCNIDIDHAEAKVYRLKPRYNPEVNQYWMCDEGRFGYKFVNDNRLTRPHVQENGHLVEVTYEEAVSRLVSLLGLAARSGIAFVAHAMETSENNQAWHDFARSVFDVPEVYYSRREVPNPFHDDFLITADKNPNQHFIDKLKMKPVSKLTKARGLFVLNNLSDADADTVRAKNIPVLALFATNFSAITPMAKVIFPIPTYAEQEGHFTNVDGIVQKMHKAFEPKGEAVDLIKILSDLREVLEPRIQPHL